MGSLESLWAARRQIRRLSGTLSCCVYGSRARPMILGPRRLRLNLSPVPRFTLRARPLRRPSDRNYGQLPPRRPKRPTIYSELQPKHVKRVRTTAIYRQSCRKDQRIKANYRHNDRKHPRFTANLPKRQKNRRTTANYRQKGRKNTGIASQNRLARFTTRKRPKED